MNRKALYRDLVRHMNRELYELLSSKESVGAQIDWQGFASLNSPWMKIEDTLPPINRIVEIRDTSTGIVTTGCRKIDFWNNTVWIVKDVFIDIKEWRYLY